MRLTLRRSASSRAVALKFCVRGKEMKKQNAFTLIELLVVVAIIAVLIAMLLPALQSAKRMSVRAQCGSNWRQVGTFCRFYQNDNMDRMFLGSPDHTTVTIYYWGGNGISSRFVGFGMLRPYLPQTSSSYANWQGVNWLNLVNAYDSENMMKRGPFSCPGGRKQWSENLANIMYILPYTDQNITASNSSWGTKPPFPYPSPDPGMASDTAVGICETYWISPWQANVVTPTCHNGEGITILYLDGHAEWRNTKKIKPYITFEAWTNFKIAYNR